MQALTAPAIRRAASFGLKSCQSKIYLYFSGLSVLPAVECMMLMHHNSWFFTEKPDLPLVSLAAATTRVRLLHHPDQWSGCGPTLCCLHAAVASRQPQKAPHRSCEPLLSIISCTRPLEARRLSRAHCHALMAPRRAHAWRRASKRCSSRFVLPLSSAAFVQATQTAQPVKSSISDCRWHSYSHRKTRQSAP